MPTTEAKVIPSSSSASAPLFVFSSSFSSPRAGDNAERPCFGLKRELFFTVILIFIVFLFVRVKNKYGGLCEDHPAPTCCGGSCVFQRGFWSRGAGRRGGRSESLPGSLRPLLRPGQVSDLLSSSTLFSFCLLCSLCATSSPLESPEWGKMLFRLE